MKFINFKKCYFLGRSEVRSSLEEVKFVLLWNDHFPLESLWVNMDKGMCILNVLRMFS